MVSPALQSAIEALSLEERLELLEYLESTVAAASEHLTEAQKTTIRARHAGLEADPSMGLSWDELDSRIGARWA